jgi:hypothetical protein
MATKIKTIAPGGFFEITPAAPWFMMNCTVFKTSFEDADALSVERLLTQSFWRVGN